MKQKFRKEFSIIIAARNEDDYIYTLANTPPGVIREIIVVDDASSARISLILSRDLTRHEKGMVKVVRFDTPQGLIRSRIVGADLAVAQNIFFLDGHCRPKPGWHRPLLEMLKSDYKTLACPIIQDINETTWEDAGTQGSKMMFSWNFEFDWYDDYSEEVPLSAGGILAITKRWWNESGKYDPGMLEWGGENLEQSIRVWCCGGNIKVARDSYVGHIFNRPPKPNPGNTLVRQVQKNQKRAALVWLDDYYEYFEKLHQQAHALDEGPGLEHRMLLRQHLNCSGFEWYVEKFRSAFERKGMLLNRFHNIQHTETGFCLTASGTSNVRLTSCSNDDIKQRWQAIAGGRMLYNQGKSACLKMGEILTLKPCAWDNVLSETGSEQIWLFEQNATNKIFTRPAITGYGSATGSDIFYWKSELASLPDSFCLIAKPRDQPGERFMYEISVQSCHESGDHWQW